MGGGGIEEDGEAVVEGDLEEEGRGPEQEGEGGGGPIEADVGKGEEESEGGEEFGDHGGSGDEGGEELVAAFVGGEALGGYGEEEGVMDDLDEPDEAGHVEAEGEVGEQEAVRRHERQRIRRHGGR